MVSGERGAGNILLIVFSEAKTPFSCRIYSSLDP